MLDVMRRGASSWFSKLILSLIILSFIAFGATTRLSDIGGPQAAIEIGSTRVTAPELDERYRRALANYGNRYQLGRSLTREEATRYGLAQQILSDIVARATLSQQVDAMGLGMSDDGVRQVIFDDPAFKGANGQFDRNLLRRVLYNNGFTEDTYITDRREDAMRDQIHQALVGGLKPSSAMLEMLNRYALEERVIEYVTLDAAMLGVIADPTAADLQTFFDARKAAFKAPELRSVQIMIVDPAKVSRVDDVTDDEAKAIYDRDVARYTVPEKRRVQQIPFDSKDLADAAAKRLSEGVSFDTLVTEMKLKPEDIDQGLLDRARFVDPAVADAAFKLAKPNDVSGVIAGRFRNVIIRVSEITPEVRTPFEEAKGPIKQQIAAERADPAVKALLKQIEAARDERGSFADIAKRFKLDITVVLLDKDGRDGAGKPITTLPEPDKIAKASFDTDIGNQNEALVLGSGGSLFYDVTQITPPRDRTLDEIKDDLVQRWKAEQVRIRLATKSTELVARLEKGEAFDEVAKSAELELKTSDPFKRSDSPAGLTPAVIKAAFSGAEGAVTTATTEQDGRMIIRVKDISDPAFFAEAESLKGPAEQYGTSLASTVENEYLRRVQANAGIHLNQQVIGQVLGITRPN